MSLTRHAIREKTLQSLFSLTFNSNQSQEEAIKFALTYNKENDENVIMSDDLTNMVNQIYSRQDELDRMIEPYLKNWKLQRIAKVDLLIMRIAVFEMLGDEVPNVVAIHEAIQLAKDYTTVKSRKFINAVLANILNEIGE